MPSDADAWLVALSELDGVPVVVQSLSAAAALGLPVRVTGNPVAVASARDVVATAGLAGVELVEGSVASWPSLADQAGLARPGRAEASVEPGLAVAADGGAEERTESGSGAGPGAEPLAAVLVHDPLCPLAPPAHLGQVLARAAAGAAGRSVVAVRPMTDTVKVRDGDRVTGTVDRSRLRVLATPISVPVAVARQVPAVDAATDLVGLVDQLQVAGDVEFVHAPPLARRVHDRTGLQVLLGLRDIEERDDPGPRA